MTKDKYYNLESAQKVGELVSTVCKVEDNKVIAVEDKEKLESDVIYTLQFNASVNEDVEVKQSAIGWIVAIAENMNIKSGSNSDFYNKKKKGEHQFFTVPAVNARMVTFHMVRAALKAFKSLKLPHIIFELAISEVGYTGQQKDEYAAVVKAAYISLGLRDSQVFLQADHYQLNPKNYAEDKDKETKRIQDAIVKALENGVYNIDIDTSKFEGVDPNKSDRENQMENARLTAELLHFIRQYEKQNNLPQVVSVGGEVGEVGGGNTRYPQVNAYLELLKEELDKLGGSDLKGLDKVSINVGSAHGGVLGPDGKPLDNVPLDFQAHHDLYMKGKDPMDPDSHVLSVQHGASTLPKSYFSLFPAMHIAEVHLATGFQNVVWDVLESEDNDLFTQMKKMVFDKFGEKIAKHKTEAIGFVKERKRVTEFVKRELLVSHTVDTMENELEKEFTTLFYSLYNVLLPKAGTIVEGDRSD